MKGSMKSRLEAMEAAVLGPDAAAPLVSFVEDGLAHEHWQHGCVTREVPDLPAYLAALEGTNAVVIIDDIPKEEQA